MSKSYSFPALIPCLKEVLPLHFSHRTNQLFGPAQTLYCLVDQTALGQAGYRRMLSNQSPETARQLGWGDEKKPSATAYCRARPKLTLAHCQSGFDAVRGHCKQAVRRPEFRYDERDVFLLDGTGLSLPCSDELLEKFGSPSNGRGPTNVPAAHMVMLWNASTQCPIDYQLSPYKHDERKQAAPLLKNIPENGIVICDRGFYSYEMLGDFIASGRDFLLRVKVSACNEIKAFVAGLANEAIITIPPPSDWSKAKQRSSPIFSVRAIRVQTRDGKSAVYLTSLRKKDGHTISRLAKLYKTRWRIETAFDELKNWHAMAKFSSHLVLGIHQEIYAAFIFQTLVAELEALARKEVYDLRKAARKKRKTPEALPDIRFNRRLISDAVNRLLVVATQSPSELQAYLDAAINDIYRYRVKRRPGRVYDRNRKSPRAGYLKRGSK